MDISAVNSAASAYGVTNQSSKVAATNQSGNFTETNLVNSVSLSPEAIAAQRQEQYAPKTAFDLFNEWKESGATRISIQLPVLPNQPKNNNLLPENQQLMDSLSEKMKNTPDNHERILISNKINFLHAIGDKELFKSEADINKRYDAIQDSIHLQQRYLTEKYGNSWGENPPINGYSQVAASTDTPMLWDLTGKKFSPEPPAEIASSYEPKDYDLERFKDADFLMGLLDERNKNDVIAERRHKEIMNDFNHPYWNESLK